MKSFENIEEDFAFLGFDNARNEDRAAIPNIDYMISNSNIHCHARFGGNSHLSSFQRDDDLISLLIDMEILETFMKKLNH